MGGRPVEAVSSPRRYQVIECQAEQEPQAMSRQNVKGLWDCEQAAQLLQSMCLNSDSHRGRIYDCAVMSMSGPGMQKIQNLGSYVFETQGSGKH
jgi:hypothetical protein